MHELKEWRECEAPLLSSAPGSSFHGFSILVELYWPFMIQQFCVSSICWDFMYFYNFLGVWCLSQVQGISIEVLVQCEKIVTDIYKMLQHICSKGMVKGIRYFFVVDI
jgi:hypothetical protein